MTKQLKPLTYGSLIPIISTHSYVLLRRSDSSFAVFNCRLCLIILNRGLRDLNQSSPFISYQPIDFSTYMTHKTPLSI